MTISDQDILHAPVLQLGQDVQPELGALGLGGPHTENFLCRDTFRHITVRRESEQYEQVIRVTVDGAVVNGAGVDGTGRTQA